MKNGIVRLIILCSILLVIKIPVSSAASTSFALDEEELKSYLAEIFEVDTYSDYGFSTDDIGQMTFGDPIAIYDLNPSFAFGESDVVYDEKNEEWISIVYEKGKPINGFKLKKGAEGHFEISGFGYPLTLARGVEQLQKDEILLHEFPTGYYYAYHTETNNVRLLEEEIISLHSDEKIEKISKEEFQNILEERYDEIEKGDETISGFGASEPTKQQPIWLYSSLGGVAVLSMAAFIVWRRKKA